MKKNQTELLELLFDMSVKELLRGLEPQFDADGNRKPPNPAIIKAALSCLKDNGISAIPEKHDGLEELMKKLGDTNLPFADDKDLLGKEYH